VPLEKLGSRFDSLYAYQSFNHRMISRCAVILMASAITACGGDVVTSHYKSLQDARSDNLFGRGWLPDVLPLSAHDIEVSNNLDLNTSAGEFSFAPSEFATLRAKLTPIGRLNHPFATSFDSEVKDHLASGNPALQYTDYGNTWIFLCNPLQGTCTYTMWTTTP
jgi:hypothetical protein